MKDKIQKYVDDLFDEVYETQPLRELKEEMNANLLEKVQDLIAKGNREEAAFQKAVSSLGDMSELVESLKKAALRKNNADSYRTFPLAKKQVAGYACAAAVFLVGAMSGGLVYLQHKELLPAVVFFLPFILISAPLFAYFGLIQETRHHYGMNSKRAVAYSAAGEALLIGVAISGLLYLQHREALIVFGTLMPFGIVSAIAFMYLGLTEKKRRKLGPGWDKQWIEYYSNPRSAMLMGGISGALWILSIAVFFIVGFTLGWKYSWIVFLFAIGLEAILGAFFAAGKR